MGTDVFFFGVSVGTFNELRCDIGYGDFPPHVWTFHAYAHLPVPVHARPTQTFFGDRV
eukprot:NODE_9160_length_269_cov_3.181818_g8420_i0.p2 GENE.NODE_9160_length_269_cov_3.181818_g8420_i0~~NODE_9160_length_269_cov_3.181818_g8420_i0.p2  ORF type:complete len:58 (+),score=5.48 NODE_9160_length_269_cov_3.181818_g8420_i0:35-208(+)